MTKVSGYEGETIDLPAGWQRCDGSTIEHPSPWAGKLTPDLNNEKRFLRGGHDNEQLTMEEDAVKSHTHSTQDSYLNRYHGCHSGMTHVDTIGYYNDEIRQDDWICQRQLTSGTTGGEETKPKNMNVIFIMRVF